MDDFIKPEKNDSKTQIQSDQDTYQPQPAVIEPSVLAGVQPAPVKEHKHKLPRKVLFAGALAIALIGAATTFVLLRDDKKAPAPQAAQSVTEKSFGVAAGLIEGTAEYSTDGKTWQKLTGDTDLKEGNEIRTADASRAVLLIDDGSAVRLDANSRVKLTDLAVKNVVITNISGEIYSRVVASNSRTYAVEVGSETYKAKGTAYRTYNEPAKKGVEVFHSMVEVSSVKTVVNEGSYLLSQTDQKDKEGKVLALDLESLKTDEFIKWNSEQDKKVANYADKLGVLSELDKPAPAPAPAPAPSAAGGISLSGKKSEYSAVFSWKATGIDTSKGYKLVRSNKTASPTYPEHSVAFIEAGKTSYTLYVGDGQSYNYRLCAYRETSCASYSNTVTVSTDKKAKTEVTAGAVTINLNSSILDWSFDGTAPYGFKVLVGDGFTPTYDNNTKKLYTEDTSMDLSGVGLIAGKSYSIKVCKYTDGGCTDYSNQVVYTP